MLVSWLPLHTPSPDTVNGACKQSAWGQILSDLLFLAGLACQAGAC